jgi:hypothetical protein
VDARQTADGHPTIMTDTGDIADTADTADTADVGSPSLHSPR